MKKFILCLLSAALVLSLAACGGKESEQAAFDPDDAQSLLDSGAFSEALTEVEVEVACGRYGVDPDTVTGGAAYASSGLTAEELALFTFDTPQHAEDAGEAMKLWLKDQTEAMADYLPKEVSKLNDGVIEVRGNSVLLAVANDYGPIQTFKGA